jgi:hypothetical protein
MLSLTLEGQRHLLQWHELISAWSALEVFILAIAVAMLEIGLVSGFVVGKNCNAIQVWLGDLVTYALLDEADQTCFLIEAKVKFGLYLLVIASVLTSLASRAITSLAEEAVVDRQRLLDAATSPAAAEPPSAADRVAQLEEARPVGCGYKMLQSVLLGMQGVHVWDKSWDVNFFGADAEAHRGSQQGQPHVDPLDTIFFGAPDSSEGASSGAAGSDLGPSVKAVVSAVAPPDPLADASRFAQQAVALDGAGGSREQRVEVRFPLGLVRHPPGTSSDRVLCVSILQAAELYDRAAVSLRQQVSAPSVVPRAVNTILRTESKSIHPSIALPKPHRRCYQAAVCASPADFDVFDARADKYAQRARELRSAPDLETP